MQSRACTGLYMRAKGEFRRRYMICNRVHSRILETNFPVRQSVSLKWKVAPFLSRRKLSIHNNQWISISGIGVASHSIPESSPASLWEPQERQYRHQPIKHSLLHPELGSRVCEVFCCVHRCWWLFLALDVEVSARSRAYSRWEMAFLFLIQDFDRNDTTDRDWYPDAKRATNLWGKSGLANAMNSCERFGRTSRHK